MSMEVHDNKGQALAAGDEVLVRCTVTRVLESPQAFGPTLELATAVPMPGTSLPTTMLVHAAQVEFVQHLPRKVFKSPDAKAPPAKGLGPTDRDLHDHGHLHPNDRGVT